MIGERDGDVRIVREGREDRRSHGIGARLLAAACDHCRERGGRTLVLATAAASIQALKFYQRQGFRIQRVIRDFYSPERGYLPIELDGIPLRDEVMPARRPPLLHSLMAKPSSTSDRSGPSSPRHTNRFTVCKRR